MSYGVVEANSADELQRMVNDLVKKGWQPQGGVAVSHAVFTDRDDLTCSAPVWAQALVKP